MENWTVTIWGQPVSLNDIYEVQWRYATDGRRYKGIGKKSAAIQYQNDAILQFASAKPNNWRPLGFIRLTYRFYLSTDSDCDNLKKLLHDALQSATGINDTWFLTTDQFKTKVTKALARVEIDIVEDQESVLWDLALSPAGQQSHSSRTS